MLHECRLAEFIYYGKKGREMFKTSNLPLLHFHIIINIDLINYIDIRINH